MPLLTQLLKSLLKNGKVVMSNLPHDLKVYAKVLMNRDVSEPVDFSPRNIRIYGLEFSGHSVTGLTNNLDLFDRRKLLL